MLIVHVDGTETWMLYHATDDPNSNEFSTRIARADRVIWAEDHAPIFPRPTNQRTPSPSGQTRFVSESGASVVARFTSVLMIVSVAVLLY